MSKHKKKKKHAFNHLKSYLLFMSISYIWQILVNELDRKSLCDFFFHFVMCMCLLPVCVCTSCACNTCGGQKIVSDTLELNGYELLYSAGKSNPGYLEGQQVLLSTRPFLQLLESTLYDFSCVYIIFWGELWIILFFIF